MLDVLGQATLRTLVLAAIVQLGLGLLRIHRPQLRLVAWTVVLAASLAMPALQWATPLRLPIVPNLPVAALSGPADPSWQAPVSQKSMPAYANAIATPARAIPWLEAAYLLICGILLLRLTVGLVLTMRLLRKAVPVRLTGAAEDQTRISRDIVAPVTVAHVILLPADVVTWSASMCAAVLAHERAHVARRDFAMLLASQVNRAVFWFSPLSWWLHRRLAALAELASDDQAMEATGDRSGYAEVLLEMGRRSGPLLRGLAMARPATLIDRIERILSDRARTDPATPLQQVILALGLASFAILAASSRPNLAPPAVPAELVQTPIVAGLEPLPLAPAGNDGPEPLPMRALRTETASQMPPQPVAAAPAAAPSYPPAARAMAQPNLRLATRSPPPPPPLRPMVQRTRTERDPATHDVSPKAGSIVAAAFAPRSNEGHGTTNTFVPAGPDRQATPVFERIDEPSCTGVYLPRPGSPRADGSVDFVQAKYFQEPDGTPWLKLFLGVRTKARLTGFDVERASIRTTVLTTLPRGTSRVTGTTDGAYGTIDFECIQPHAHL